MQTVINLIVGIGASAGGLRALEDFFGAVPVDSGCCFVVVQHLSPDHKSALEDLLARHTVLPIHRVENGMAPAPNAIFLIPPKKLLTLRDGQFQLSEHDIASVAELPINVFFLSLAVAAGVRAVGVVFSGGGSDGARGVVAIHQAGGLVLVQEPETAEFDSMPRHALAANVADYCLAPRDMPAALIAHSLKPDRPTRPTDASDGPDDDAPNRIMKLLRNAFGIDFDEYKIATIDRRMQRRMALQKQPSLAAYADLLTSQPEELNALYSDLLIGVTEFFRNAEAFEALQQKVLPGLLVEARQHELRVWVPGCATGEEAYSLAIAIDEVARTTGFAGRISIFATDVHRASLDFAGAGLYGQSQLKNVSPERLARYFREEENGRFRIIPEIRKRLVFTSHNLVCDPPFAKLDLVSCRNLLIYFSPMLKNRAIQLFYYSLRPGGCLFLGPSEDIGRLEGTSFQVLNSQLKLFRKEGNAAVSPPLFRKQPNLRHATAPVPPSHPASGSALNRQLLAAYDHILAQHLPAGLLVNEAFAILHYFGAANRYLRPLEGRAHVSLLDRVEGDLHLCLSTLLPRVFRSGSRATSHGVRIPGADGDERIDIIAEPIAYGHSPVSLVHLSFVNPRQAPPPVVPAAGNFVAGDEIMGRVRDLEAELLSTKENLQTAVEELQTTIEELQASNEELTAANEELQSTNEELSAVNEELYTVNAEFERKNIELQLLNDDLTNLSNSIDAGTVFVDREMRIRKFNPAIQKIFRLVPQDIGRPIDHIAYLLDGQELMLSNVRWVMQHGKQLQKEVRTRDGHWLQKRLQPFFTANGAIEGVILTFTNIDETKALHDRLELAMTSSRLVWWDWDLRSDRLTVHSLNACFLDYTPQTLPTTGKIWQDTTHPDDLARVCAAIQACLDGEVAEWSCEHRFRKGDGAWCWVLNSGKITDRAADHSPLRMLGTTQDISARHLAEEIVHRDAEVLSKINEALICVDKEGIVTYWNRGATKLFGWTESEMLGRSYFERFPAGEARDQAWQRMDIAMSIGEFRHERQDYRKDGSRVWVDAAASHTFDRHGRQSGIIALFRDITGRINEEQKRRQLEHQLYETQKMETIGTLAGGIAHDFNNIIAGILGHTELALLTLRPDDPARRFHEVVLTASHRARDLVKRILAFSHKHEPERKPVQLAEIVTDAAKFIRAILPATVELQLEMDKASPGTLADANQIHQVLMNLAANAAYAMRDCGGRLTIRLRTVVFANAHATATGPLSAGTYLALAMVDLGQGIDAEALNKIFDPFFTTKPIGEGTGLGLSIVRGIIEGHGGAIEVESKPGVGTTFTLYFPAMVSDNSAAAPVLPPPTTLPRGQGERIVVIDDEENVAQAAQLMLQSLGYHVRSYSSAERFHEDFLREPGSVDLLLTDQTMPHLTGLQLAQKLRASGETLPILIVSGYSRNLTPDTLSAMGGIELLKKPYELADLARVVRRMLPQPPTPETR
jgi:two-component system CheB/CheR fusion protein